MIGELKKIYDNLLDTVNLDFQRNTMSEIENRSIGPIALIGERGIGKTYLLLQLLKKSQKKSFYFSADNQLVKGVGLFKTVSELYFDYGVRLLVIDEIQKGEDRISNLKSCIDSFPDLELIVSGSSSLDLYTGTAALQRRIYKVDMTGLTFVEFLSYSKNITIPSYSFDTLIQHYKQLSFDLSKRIDLNDFKEYMQFGFYPYFKSKKEVYHNLLLNNIKKTILEDLPTFMNLQTSSLSKLEKMFYFIAKNQPSDLNYKSLAEKLDISKDLLETIIYYLDQIGVLNIAIRSNKLNDIIRKEFKIFLGNPNIYYSFGEVRIGTIRESFVLSVLKKINKSQIINDAIILPDYGDFFFKYKDKGYLFEVGGNQKTNKQVQGIDNSFCVKDDILLAQEGEIPLWMFGLLK